FWPASRFQHLGCELMRILVLEDWASSRAGGAERSMRAFCEHLTAQHEVYLAYARKGDLIDNPALAFIYAGTFQLTLISARLLSAPAFVSDLRRLDRYVKVHRIDRIITHMVHVSPLLLALQRIAGIPFSIYFKWVCSTESAGAKVRWGNSAVLRAAAISRFA